MSDMDDIDEIREKKKRELRQGAGGSGGAASPDEPLHVSGVDGFDQVVSEHPVVLVDFYADWCGPCKKLAPVVDSVAASSDAAVAKVDIDQNPGLAQRFGVQGVPTLILFSDGEPVDKNVGFQPESALHQMIGAHG